VSTIAQLIAKSWWARFALPTLRIVVVDDIYSFVVHSFHQRLDGFRLGGRRRDEFVEMVECDRSISCPSSIAMRMVSGNFI
jgi:hypothetical protein